MATPHNCQFLSPSGQSIRDTLMGISEEIEVATIATQMRRQAYRIQEIETTIALPFRSRLTMLVVRWGQRNLPKSVLHIISKKSLKNKQNILER